MIKYIVKRLLQLIPVIIVTSFLIYWAMNLTSGDPALLIAGDKATPEMLEQIREEMGLNDPFLVRYGRYMLGMIQGDMGESYITGKDVFQTFMETLPNTLMLGGAAVLIAVIIALPLGIYTAIHQSTWKDNVGMVFALFGTAMPNFWLGLQLMQIFSVNLGIFPTGGLEDWRGYVLPSIAMGAGIMAILARVTRSSMIENLGKYYIRVIMVHAFKNSSIDIITVTALQIGALIAGSVVVESVFSIPGMGRLLVDSIGFRDYEVVQALILFFSFEYMVINLLADILYAVINPRVRYE